MEQKPADAAAPPTSDAPPSPSQESQGAPQNTNPLPTIVLPPDATPSTPTLAPPADPLLSNTDYVALKKFVDAGMQQSVVINENELIR